MMISVIIVNYNGKRYLSDCLSSIEEHVPFPHEVILVDNASTDGSSDYIREHYPSVRLVQNRSNKGYSAGNNIGAICAQGTLLVLMNNDARLLSSIMPAVKLFDGDTLGVLGCRMYYADGRNQASYGYDHSPCSIVVSWLGLDRFIAMPAIFKRVEIEASRYTVYQSDVAWVSGAFMMTRKDLWFDLGGMDSNYFMYMEDVDYCKRVRDAGFRVGYVPDVEMLHYEGGGKPWIGENALRMTMRSYFIYVRKYYGRCSTLFLWLGLSVVMTVRAIMFCFLSIYERHESNRSKARAYGGLLPHLFGCLVNKKEVLKQN